MKRIFKALGILVLLAAVGLLCYAAYTMLIAPQNLRYRWKPGKLLTYGVTSEAKVEGRVEFSEESAVVSLSRLLERAAGQPGGALARWLERLKGLEGTVTQQSTVRLEAQNVSEAGAQLSGRLERLVWELKPGPAAEQGKGSGESVRLEWDGNVARVEGPGEWLGDRLAEDVQEELSRSFALSVSPQGMVSGESLGTWAGVAFFLSGFPQKGPGDVFLALPEQPVKRGETWTRTVSPGEAQPGQLQGLVSASEPMTFNYKLTDIRFRGLHRVADIAYDCDYSGDLTPKVLKGPWSTSNKIEFGLKASGSGEFDITCGRILSTKEQQSMKLHVTLDLILLTGLPGSGTVDVELKTDGERTVSVMP